MIEWKKSNTFTLPKEESRHTQLRQNTLNMPVQAITVERGDWHYAEAELDRARLGHAAQAHVAHVIARQKHVDAGLGVVVEPLHVPGLVRGGGVVLGQAKIALVLPTGLARVVANAKEGGLVAGADAVEWDKAEDALDVALVRLGRGRGRGGGGVGTRRGGGGRGGLSQQAEAREIDRLLTLPPPDKRHKRERKIPCRELTCWSARQCA